MGTYVVTQSNFDTNVTILKPHKSILASQFKICMCLRNKSHLNTLKLSARYSHLSTYLCVRTRGRTNRKIIFLSHTLNIRESDTASLVEFRVFKHIYNHFRENSIITLFQSGFTPGDPTVNQLIYLYNTFCQALDSGKFALYSVTLKGHLTKYDMLD